MSADLLSPPPHLPPAAALRLSQEAPRVLGNSSSKSLPYPFSLLYAAESPETWIRYENLLLACLRTGDDRSARLCLERLAERFGDPNQRVKALRGLYQEAVAPDNNALEAILKSYEKEIKDDPANMPIRKRRIALLKSMSKVPDAIAALVELLDVSPTDVEAWSELADLYLTQKLYPQAVFSMEEVLLITPNAWNAHARMGELLYISAISTTNNDGGTTRILSESIKRFCRSIELCENYLRGYYGLNLTAGHLLGLLSKSSSTFSGSGTPGLPLDTVKQLHELATSKLAEIIRRGTVGEIGWEGYEEAELIAARELLDRGLPSVVR